MSIIGVGTSGWNYPTGRGTWNGIFYPARRRRGFDELAYYAEHFDTVEVNSTFYRMPEPELSRSWLRRTPGSFAFAVKLYQKFTHPDMYLARPGAHEWDVSQADLDQFCLGIDPMVAAGRLTAVLLQFPPSFHAEPATRDYLDWIMTALRSLPIAVELRHASWRATAAQTAAQLAACGAAWVIGDEPFGPPLPAMIATGPRDTPARLTYFRFHGRRADTWWTHETAEDRYDYLYSAEELMPFARAAQEASRTGGRVVMYLNNHFSAKAVANAVVLKHALDEPVPGEYPREMVDRYPELAGIVHMDGLPL